MSEGWVKLYRKFVEWRWYTDANTKSVFLHLLITANYEDKPWRDITIRRGQRVASYGSLAKELQLSPKQIRTAINHLKETGEVASKAASKYSIITILNYDKYQDKYCEGSLDDDGERASKGAGERAGKGQAEGRQGATTKEDKNSKNGKNSITTPLPPSSNIPYQEIQTAYNETCDRLPKVVAMTEGRRKAIRARWNTYPDIETFKEVFVRTARSDFLNGSNDRNWLASFDWLMKEQNMAKVLEGKYENRKEVKADGDIDKRGVGPDGRYHEYHAPEEYDRMYITSLSEVQ